MNPGNTARRWRIHMAILKAQTSAFPDYDARIAALEAANVTCCKNA